MWLLALATEKLAHLQSELQSVRKKLDTTSSSSSSSAKPAATHEDDTTKQLQFQQIRELQEQANRLNWELAEKNGKQSTHLLCTSF